MSAGDVDAWKCHLQKSHRYLDVDDQKVVAEDGDFLRTCVQGALHQRQCFQHEETQKTHDGSPRRLPPFPDGRVLWPFAGCVGQIEFQGAWHAYAADGRQDQGPAEALQQALWHHDANDAS